MSNQQEQESLPTPEEIREQCAKIRQGWSLEEMNRRIISRPGISGRIVRPVPTDTETIKVIRQ